MDGNSRRVEFVGEGKVNSWEDGLRLMEGGRGINRRGVGSCGVTMRVTIVVRGGLRVRSRSC